MKVLLSNLLITALIILGVANCTRSSDGPHVHSFVLVHGAWQAPYVWKDVQKNLERQNNKVIVVELPGHGADTSGPATLSIDVYRDKVIEAIKGLKSNVILVGHSMGGMVITAVAEKIPSKIEKLVYIGAFVPANGQSLLDLSLLDKQSQLGASLIPSKDQLLLDVKPENLITIFCQDANAQIQKEVKANYRPEPAIPFTNKASITETNFGRVDKYYIHTLEDHAVGIDQQYAMASAAHIKKSYSLNTGHSPFLTQPQEVSRILLEISR